MAKIADADKMRAGKLDKAWVEAVWVDKSNEHLSSLTNPEVHRLPLDTLKGNATTTDN